MPNDVGTYVEFVSESTKETGLTYGTSGTNGTTESVSRTINEFNGAVTDTFLVFKLHPLRQAFTAACDTNSAKITDSTYQIIVNHYPALTCFQPTNLTVDWTMSDQAQLSWTTGGSSSWEVEYGAPGFTPGTGTRARSIDQPIRNYRSYRINIVRVHCSRFMCGRKYGIWSAAAEDSTRCAPITFTTSYTENFNSTTDWVPGSGFDNDGSTVPSCWLRIPRALTVAKATHGVLLTIVQVLQAQGHLPVEAVQANIFMRKLQVQRTKVSLKLRRH